VGLHGCDRAETGFPAAAGFAVLAGSKGITPARRISVRHAAVAAVWRHSIDIVSGPPVVREEANGLTWIKAAGPGLS